MVRSTISNVNYPENYSIIERDNNVITNMYEVEYVVLPQAKELVPEELEPGEIKTIQIALGQLTGTQRNKDFVIKPIYVINEGRTMARIGYYEIRKDELEGEDIALEDMKEPLMFMYEGIRRFLEAPSEKKVEEMVEEKVEEMVEEKVEEMVEEKVVEKVGEKVDEKVIETIEEEKEEEKEDEEKEEEEKDEEINDSVPEPENKEPILKELDTYKDYESIEFVKHVPKMANQLYDPNTIFRFYSKSKDNVDAGKGKDESISESSLSKYDFSGFEFVKKLNRTKELDFNSWRKKLSNFWKAKFKLDGKTWMSVEHYYQASKYKKSKPELYASFSVDSGTPLSNDPLLAKKEGRKHEPDPDFFQVDKDTGIKRADYEMYLGQYAKFTQIPSLKKMLGATGDAGLKHISRGIPDILFENLIVIRHLIQTNKI